MPINAAESFFEHNKIEAASPPCAFRWYVDERHMVYCEKEQGHEGEHKSSLLVPVQDPEIGIVHQRKGFTAPPLR